MHSVNTKQTALCLLLVASDAYARGGPGNGKLLLAVVVVVGFWGAVYLIHRTFPKFFPGVAGLFMWFLIGGGVTALLEYFGWVPSEYFGVATVVVTFALIVIPVFVSWWRVRRRTEDHA